MEFLIYVLIGTLSGWIYAAFDSENEFGLFGGIVIGTVGAIGGGLVRQFSGLSWFGYWGSVIMSASGAVLFLFIADLFAHERSYPAPRH